MNRVKTALIVTVLLLLDALALSDILSGESALWHEWAVLALSGPALVLIFLRHRRRQDA